VYLIEVGPEYVDIGPLAPKKQGIGEDYIISMKI
jgi:hypothetical protein